MRAAFHAADDAWHDVEHLEFGPMTFRLRAERLYFWPDPRNTTARQLAELLAGRDPATLTAESLGRASAAVQGLPATERLLFDEGAGTAFRREGEEGRRRCEVLEAMTRNIKDITGDVVREWNGGEVAYGRRIETAGPGNAAYAEPKEPTQEFLKSLHGALERVASLKLAKPLGTSLATARPMLVEEWRSGRALRDVRLNLAAARALYLGDGGFGLSDFVRDVAQAPEIDAPASPWSRPVHRGRRQDPGAARVGGQERRARARRWSGSSRRSGPSATWWRSTSRPPSTCRSASTRSMATDSPGPSRRQVLVWLAALVARRRRGRAPRPTAPLYLSARNDAAGRHYASGFDATGAPRFDLTLAGRGHAFAVHPAAAGGGPLLAAPGHGRRSSSTSRAGAS